MGRKSTKMKTYSGECEHCGNNNKEMVEFTKKIWFFTIKTKVCQTCISRAFRSFVKNK